MFPASLPVNGLKARFWSHNLGCISMFVYVGELVWMYKYTWTCIHIHMKTRRICYTSILPSTFFLRQALSLASTSPRCWRGWPANLRDLSDSTSPALRLQMGVPTLSLLIWVLGTLPVEPSHQPHLFLVKWKGQTCYHGSKFVSTAFQSYGWRVFLEEPAGFPALFILSTVFWDDWWRGLSEKNKLFLIFLVILSFPGMISSGHFVWAHTEGLYSRCFLSIF